jgi:hypothetical protein
MMGERSISTPAFVVIVAVVVVVAGFLLFKGATGGTVGDGHTGRVEASPPMPDAAKQDMLRQHGRG